MKAVVFLLVLSVSLCCNAKEKERVWHEGLLTDVQTEHGSRIVGSGGIVATKRNDLALYTIDEGKMIWICGRTMTSRHDKMLKLTINAKIKFAIEGDNCYLMDEDGKEHKVGLERKEVKKAE